jgi:hypothetical protein
MGKKLLWILAAVIAFSPLSAMADATPGIATTGVHKSATPMVVKKHHKRKRHHHHHTYVVTKHHHHHHHHHHKKKHHKKPA